MITATQSPDLETILAKRASDAKQGDWHPLPGESVMIMGGRRLQYCWQPSTGDHRYYDLDADLVLEYSEFEALCKRSSDE